MVTAAAAAGRASQRPRRWRPGGAHELGIEVIDLDGDRLTGLRGADERGTYRRAKSTLAVVVSPFT